MSHGQRRTIELIEEVLGALPQEIPASGAQREALLDDLEKRICALPPDAQKVLARMPAIMQRLMARQSETAAVMAAAEYLSMILDEAESTDAIETAMREIRERHPSMSDRTLGFALGLAAGREKPRR